MQNADVNEVERLVSSGQVDVSAITVERGSYRWPWPLATYSATILHHAVWRNNMEVLRLLVQAWPDGLQAKDGSIEGRTPLQWAAYQGRVEALQLMLARWLEGIRSTTNSVFHSHSGTTLFHVAAGVDQVQVLQLLVERWPGGVQVADNRGEVPLHIAAEDVNRNKSFQLLRNAWPGGLLHEDSAGRTPVHLFARHAENSFEDLLFVLDGMPQGPRPRALERGGSILHQVAESGNIAAMQLLLDRWPDAIFTRPSLLEAAASFGQTEMVNFLGRLFTPEMFTYQYETSVRDDNVFGCTIVVDMGCNGTAFSQGWKNAAVELQCTSNSLSKLSLRSLQLWLECGGRVGWRDAAGTQLQAILDNEDARHFLQSRWTPAVLVASTMRDWRTWMVPGLTAAVAFAALTLQSKFKSFRRPARPVQFEDSARDEYFEGAKRLVSQTFTRHGILLRLWRWLEVYVAIVWLGYLCIPFHWSWWLPVVALSYLGPHMLLHGRRGVLHAPALAIFSRGLESHLVALLRTTAMPFLSIVFIVAYQDRSSLVNPMMRRLWLKTDRVWFNSFLNEHWLFHWAPPVRALLLVYLWACVTLGLLCLYFLCLLCAGCRKVACGRGEQAQSSGSQDREKGQFLRVLLRTPSKEFSTLSPSVKPVAAFAWPWQGGGLWFEVAMLVLDVALDVNTIYTFLAAQDYLFAAVMTFVVSWSGMKQLIALPPWRLRQAPCLRQDTSK